MSSSGRSTPVSLQPVRRPTGLQRILQQTTQQHQQGEFEHIDSQSPVQPQEQPQRVSQERTQLRGAVGAGSTSSSAEDLTLYSYPSSTLKQINQQQQQQPPFAQTAHTPPQPSRSWGMGVAGAVPGPSVVGRGSYAHLQEDVSGTQTPPDSPLRDHQPFAAPAPVRSSMGTASSGPGLSARARPSGLDRVMSQMAPLSQSEGAGVHDRDDREGTSAGADPGVGVSIGQVAGAGAGAPLRLRPRVDVPATPASAVINLSPASRNANARLDASRPPSLALPVPSSAQTLAQHPRVMELGHLDANGGATSASHSASPTPHSAGDEHEPLAIREDISSNATSGEEGVRRRFTLQRIVTAVKETENDDPETGILARVGPSGAFENRNVNAEAHMGGQGGQADAGLGSLASKTTTTGASLDLDCPGLCYPCRWFGSSLHALAPCLFPSVLSNDQQSLLRQELYSGVILPQDARTVNEEAIKHLLATFSKQAVLAVNVKHAETLKPDQMLLHPVVRLHLVDLRTGRYLRKTQPGKSVVYPTEVDARAAPGGGVYEYILPTMTKPCSLRKLGHFQPSWNEDFLFNEPLQHFFNPHSLLLLEVMDFGGKVDLERHPDGLYPVAWAFLKMVSMKGKPNMGRLRLQLYHYTPDRPRLKRDHTPSVYFDWVYQKTAGRQQYRYPSSLHVHLHGQAPPHPREVITRPRLPTDKEVGRTSYAEMRKLLDAGRGVGGAEGRIDEAELAAMGEQARRTLLRQRREGEACKIPNTLLHEISCGVSGCFCLAFSPNGRYLAAAVGEKLLFTIKIYDAESGTHVYTYNGHHDLVYDLCWSPAGSELVSASSDRTAKVWNVRSLRPTPMLTLQHTGFVYAARFHPKANAPRLLVTACYDGLVRVWSRDSGKLLVALDDHQAPVNSLVFAPNGLRFFTADARGAIRVWEDRGGFRHAEAAAAAANADAQSTAGSPSAREQMAVTARVKAEAEIDWPTRFQCLRTIENEEVKGDIINHLVYNARPEFLIAYCRDNSLYMFNLRRYELHKKFSGIECRNTDLKCSLSPDGRYLAAGSEDGKAYFWDLRTGRALPPLTLGYEKPVFDVAWHPSQHLVAFCSFGGDYPVLTYEFSSDLNRNTAVRTEVQDEAEEEQLDALAF